MIDIRREDLTSPTAQALIAELNANCSRDIRVAMTAPTFGWTLTKLGLDAGPFSLRTRTAQPWVAAPCG